MQSFSHVSPAMRIYRHALESVLGMLELADLNRALAVSREWAAAVRSMKTISATIERDEWRLCYVGKPFHPLPPIVSIIGSALLRHIATIQIKRSDESRTPLDTASLGLLAQRTPNLTSLWCKLTLTPNEPLILPAKLQSLDLRLDRNYTAKTINSVLTALAALPSLSSLWLGLSAFDHDPTSLELGPLAACRSLTCLDLWVSPQLTDIQVDLIRSSLGHLRHFSDGWMTSDVLARFLKLPVTARWQDVGRVIGDARTGELLLRLPSLTKLDFLSDNEPELVFDFLPQLPQLTVLHMEFYDTEEVPFPANDLVASLLQCISLMDLSLKYEFTSEQLSCLFAQLKAKGLKKLAIRRGAIETLRWFAAGPIAQSLEELTIEFGDLPPSELAHIYGLRRLRILRLNGCFSPRLDDATLASLSPPTSLLPALTELFHPCENADGEWVHIERRGPSFEWMQERRTQ